MQPKTPKRRSNFRRANRTMPRRRTDLAEEAVDYKNPELLKRIASSTGGDAFIATDKKGLESSMHAILDKLEKTREKYPVEKARGRSEKHDRL